MGNGYVCCYEVLGMSTVAGIPSVPSTPAVASVPAAVDTMLIEIIVNEDSEALLLLYMAVWPLH
jgi:hypothetical protein